MNSFLEQIPFDLREQAYIHGDEAAWSATASLDVISNLSQLAIAVLGGEVWLPTEPGPTIPTPYIYTFDTGSQQKGESSDDFVKRANLLAKEYISSFEWDPKDTQHLEWIPYFNMIVSEPMSTALHEYESRLIEKILEGEDEVLKVLRKQMEDAQVEKRDLTGVGFYLNLSIPNSASRIEREEFHIGDTFFDFDDNKAAGCVVIHGYGGKISTLEAALFATSWPDEPNITRIFHQKLPRDMDALRKDIWPK